MRLLTVRLRLSRHRAAWALLLCCVPIGVTIFRNTPQSASRRIAAYRILHDQKNLDRELLLAVFQKDMSAAKLALANGANPNVPVDIPHEIGGCSFYVPNAFVENLGGPWHIEPHSRYSPLHMALNKVCFSLQTATPLGVAVFNRNVDMTNLLLNSGARSDFPTNSIYSPLMIVAVSTCENAENLPQLQRLLKYGNNFSTKPCTIDRLPLIHAALMSNSEVL